MRLNAALAILATIFSLNGWAQVTIQGVIKDSETKSPLSGAHVDLGGSSLTVISDEKGKFKLRFENEGEVKLQVSYVGYETQVVSIDSSEILNIEMIPRVVLEEIVVKAVRADQDQPVTQSTLDRKGLLASYYGQDAVLNLERMVPSILAHSESGSNFANYSLMRLRGIDQTRINITLNGVPLNDMVDQGVFFSNFPDFTNNMQSVQVQRGVGTSTNGTASYAGSINYESARLNTPNPSGGLTLTAGSFGSVRASAVISSGLIQDKFAFSARYTKSYSDGYKFHSGSNGESLFFSAGYFGKKDLLKLNVLKGQNRNELAYLPVFIEDIRVEPRTNYLDPGDEDDFSQSVVQLQHTHWFDPQVSLTSSLYYGNAGGDFPFGFDDGTGNIVQINYPLYNDHYGFMTSVSAETNSGWQVDAGFHAYVFKRINEEGILPDKDNPYYSDRTNKDEVSVFGKVSRTFGRWNVYGDLQLRLAGLELEPDLAYLEDQGVSTTGLRVPDRNWTFVNPKVGVRYQASDITGLFLSFGYSGREPTRADILGSTVISAYNLDVILDENAVKEEYVTDLEIGTDLRFNKFQALANFFYMDFKDEIAPTGEFILEGFVQLRQNIPDSYRTGLEIDWQWKPLDKLKLGGQTTYMKSKVKTFAPGGTNEIFQDVEHILTPEWLINAKAEYKFGKHITFGISGRYVGESFLELTNQRDLVMPDFFVANAQLSLNWRSHQLDLSLNNLFNELYFTNGAPVDVDFDGIVDGPGYMVQAPRNFFATLTLNF
jgi:iron complex outermembrane receptor protein